MPSHLSEKLNEEIYSEEEKDEGNHCNENDEEDEDKWPSIEYRIETIKALIDCGCFSGALQVHRL